MTAEIADSDEGYQMKDAGSRHHFVVCHINVRLHRMHETQTIATNVPTACCVHLPVCLSVTQAGYAEMAEWIDVSVMETLGVSVNIVLDK